MDGPFIEQTGGRIALMDGDFDVSEVESQSGQEMLDGEPQVLFTVQERLTLPDGTPFFTALAVGRKKERVETVSVSGEDAAITDEEQITEQYGRVAVVPGEVAIYTTSFALGAFTHYTPVFETYPSDIDLNEWMENHDIMTTKAVGFRGRPKKGSKGALYGSQLLDDEDFGSDVQQTILNELHVNYDSPGGGITDAYFSAGGYAEVYDGCHDLAEFLQWVIEDVKPYLIETDDGLNVEKSESENEDSAGSESDGDADSDDAPQENTLDDLDTVTESTESAETETES